MKGRWHLLLLLVAVLACVNLAQTSQGHVLLADIGLYEAPATYSELAFSQPAALPGSLKEPGGDVKVSFDIHNVSNSERIYQWSIIVVNAGKSQIETTGNTPVSAQGRIGIAKSVMAACVSGRTEVFVRLATPAPVESISFWMTCLAAKKQAKQ